MYVDHVLNNKLYRYNIKKIDTVLVTLLYRYPTLPHFHVIIIFLFN
jgi:hypothetical protein